MVGEHGINEELGAGDVHRANGGAEVTESVEEAVARALAGASLPLLGRGSRT